VAQFVDQVNVSGRSNIRNPVDGQTQTANQIVAAVAEAAKTWRHHDPSPDLPKGHRCQNTAGQPARRHRCLAERFQAAKASGDHLINIVGRLSGARRRKPRGKGQRRSQATQREIAVPAPAKRFPFQCRRRAALPKPKPPDSINLLIVDDSACFRSALGCRRWANLQGVSIDESGLQRSQGDRDSSWLPASFDARCRMPTAWMDWRRSLNSSRRFQQSLGRR